MSLEREHILERIKTLESLPVAATQAVSLLESSDTDLNDIIEILQFDPGLTANILRLANSVQFSGRYTVHSLREAILRLGTKRIAQFTITAAVAPLARQPIRGYEMEAGALLEHSIAVAIGADEIARIIGIPSPTHTFTAGLLHDIGKIILGTFIEVDAAPIQNFAFEQHLSFEVAEQMVLGIDHAEVGAAALHQWGLPGAISEVVRWHHDPEQYAGDEIMAVDLVHVANALAREAAIGIGVDALNYRPSVKSAGRLRLKQLQAETAVCRMLSGVDGVKNAFGANSSKGD